MKHITKLIFVVCLLCSFTTSHSSRDLILQEVHFTYFIGNQEYEDWRWFPVTMPASDIEFHFRRWVRDVEMTAVKKWNFTGNTEVKFSEENPEI